MRTLRVVVLGLTLVAGCGTLGPPPNQLREVLPATAPDEASFSRRTAWARIESQGFSGEFNSVLVEEHGANPRVRFQLLPELGSKVLDMVVTPQRTVGYWPHLGQGFDEAGRDLIGFLSVSLLENGARLSFDRIIAGRRSSKGYELEVRPVIAGGHTRLRVFLDPDGSLLRREYRHLGVRWREVFRPVHRIEAGNFLWVISDEMTQGIDSVPTQLFELELPEGIDL